jgi:hypothetical protein
MVGRVLRPAPGKTDAIILDHSGAVFRHGFAEDPVEWTLDPDRCAESPVHAKRCEFNSSSRVLECSQCGVWGRVAGEPCPHCGFLPTAPPKPIVVRDGELGLVQGGRAQAPNDNALVRWQWLGMFTAIAQERGRSRGWVAHTHKAKFGCWPPWGTVQPIAPTPEVRAYVRSRDIAYAKAREKAAS